MSRSIVAPARAGPTHAPMPGAHKKALEKIEGFCKATGEARRLSQPDAA